jgi:hypothetical protein
MATYVISVLIVNSTGRGIGGIYVNLYGKNKVKTNSEGLATLTSNSSSVTVYANGTQIYDGSVSSAPDPIVYRMS